MTIARVVVDSPLPQLDRLFDYVIPDALAAEIAPGVRVRVPVRAQGRTMDGFVVDVAAESDYPGALSPIEAVVSPVPVLDPGVWAMARAVADRAAGVASDVLRLAIPKRRVRVEKAFLAGSARPQALPVVRPIPIDRYSAGLEGASADRRLVLRAIPEPDAWAATLASLATQRLATGESVIVVVPDQRDLERFARLAGNAVPEERMVRLDAARPDADRYADFLRAVHEEGMLVIGNRSAVYAPARRLGLIAVWDDGDPMLQEPHAPGVHARDVALLRQQQTGCDLVLAANAPSVEAERLVEIGYCRRIEPAGRPPHVVPTALQRGDEGPASQARIPSTAWRAASEALRAGPVLLQVSRPGDDAWVGSSRTAGDLGRAFPRTRIVVADGAHPIAEIGPEPALVVATRGAEPRVPGGYRAVLLLDGERMLARESLRVAEDYVRTAANASALAAPGAPVYLAGVGGRIARFLSTWRLDDFAREELASRVAARMPPAVRTATLIGAPRVVEEAIAAARIDGDDVIAPVRLEDELLRAVIRFDYRRGAEVASALKTEILRHATRRRGRPGPRAGRAPSPSIALRVRFDDPEPFNGERPVRRTGRIER